MNTKTHLIWIVFLGLFGTHSALAQPDIFVDKNATGTPDGLTWATGYTEVSVALTNASPGDEVWVADGIYLPGTSVSDTFVLPAAVEIYGGFQGNSHPSGGETSRDQRNPDPATNGTVLSGDINNDDSAGSITAPNIAIILTTAAGDSDTIVNGFTIRGATDTAVLIDDSGPTLANLLITENHSVNGDGVGIRITSNLTNSEALIASVTFSNNTGDDGGAVYITDSARPDFILCDFTANSASYGGAVAMDASGSLESVRCTFIENEALSTQGGALYLHANGASTIINGRFIGNAAAGEGGAVYAQKGASILIANGLFHENTSAIGAAIWLFNSPDAFVVNTTASRNHATNLTGGIHVGGNFAGPDSVVQIQNSILWGNTDVNSTAVENEQYLFDPSGGGTPTSTVTYSCVEGNLVTGIGNINSDPMFIDPDGPNNTFGDVDDDYKLSSSSDAIDAGSSSAVPADIGNVDDDNNLTEKTPLDYGLFPRFVNGAGAPGEIFACDSDVDMGAFEYQFGCDTCILLGDINYDSFVNGKDIQPFVTCLLDGSGGDDCGCQCGDYVGNNGVDIQDVPAFVQCLLSGGDDCFPQTECEETGEPRSGLQDCNENEVNDEVDIFYCDSEEEPGLCDCNGNGIPDICDIEAEIEDDVNENDTPDSCEADCNDNDIPDDIDIANCTTDPDCADCDENGVPDGCDDDCDDDGTPDACQTLIDCNENEIFDASEYDCDGDGVPDECELTDNDCNENLTPDDCELAIPVPFNLADCNSNDVPDICELEGNDCNENGILDSCDIANAISLDVSPANGIPDECESESVMGGGSSSSSESSEPTEEEKWAAYMDWCFATDFSSMTNGQKFTASLNKRLELGLPAGQLLP
jgi:hypothetical protein